MSLVGTEDTTIVWIISVEGLGVMLDFQIGTMLKRILNVMTNLDVIF